MNDINTTFRLTALAAALLTAYAPAFAEDDALRELTKPDSSVSVGAGYWSNDRLQQALGSDRFEVVALSVDRGGIEKSKAFFDEIGVKALKLYVDPSTRATSKLKAVGLPATLLIDEQGREIGRLTGPAEWDSEDAKRLIQAVLGS